MDLLDNVQIGRSSQEEDPNYRVGFDTRVFAENEQFGRWRDIAAKAGEINRPGYQYDEPFHGYIGAQYTSTVAYLEYASEHDSVLDRNNKAINASDDEVIMIQYRRFGQELDSNFAGGAAKAGSLRIIDSSRPFYSANGPYSALSIAIKKSTVLDRVPDIANAHGLFIPDTHLVEMFKRHMDAVRSSLQKLTPVQAEQMTDITLDMFDMAITSTDLTAVNVPQHMLFKLQQVVKENLARHDLCPDMLAGLMAMSRSSLFKLCKPFGGPMELVRQFRLLQAQKYLKRRDFVSISEVAYQVGFQSRESFTRAFRREFCCSPRDFQKGCSVPVVSDNVPWANLRFY